MSLVRSIEAADLARLARAGASHVGCFRGPKARERAEGFGGPTTRAEHCRVCGEKRSAEQRG
eukprot:10716749-Alexandrium_andersonii.AAC.1